MDIKKLNEELNNALDEDLKTPTEEDLDNIYDAIQTLNNCEWMVDEDQVDTLYKAQEILKDLYDRYDSFQ